MSYYEIDNNYTEKEKEFAWKTAIGLQDVDNIEVSSVLYNLIENNLNIEDIRSKIYDYYETKIEMKVRTEEADKVSVNIAQNLLSNGFSFSVEQFLKIHENLFNESVKYADYKEIKDLLFYDFAKEKEYMKQLNI